jgi:hypothetical protein
VLLVIVSPPPSLPRPRSLLDPMAYVSIHDRCQPISISNHYIEPYSFAGPGYGNSNSFCESNATPHELKKVSRSAGRVYLQPVSVRFNIKIPSKGEEQSQILTGEMQKDQIRYHFFAGSTAVLCGLYSADETAHTHLCISPIALVNTSALKRPEYRKAPTSSRASYAPQGFRP